MRAALLVLLAACGSSGHAPASPSGADEGRALFTDRCETCHDEADAAEKRPKILAETLDPKTANRALGRIMRGSMPPGTDHLSRADANVLGEWLCAKSGRSSDACHRIVHDERRLAPTANVFLATAGRTSGKPASDDSYFLGELRSHMRKSMASQVLDPTMIMLVSGLAIETCVPAGDLTPQQTTAVNACVDAYVDAILKQISPPKEEVP